MRREWSRWVDASPGEVWKVVADLDAYHRYVPALVETKVISGEGVGACRRCEDRSGAAWQETCVVWEPGHRYVIDVDVKTYPWRLRMLLTSFRGHWSVSPEGSGARIGIAFTAVPRRGFGWMVKAGLDRAGVDEILRGYEVELDRIGALGNDRTPRDVEESDRPVH